MGVSSYDKEAAQRRLEAAYPLEYEAGVIMLLKNYQLFAQRAILEGNFAAIDIKLDLDEAMEAAFLTDRQRECIQLYLIDDMKIEDVEQLLGIDKAAISRHASGGVKRIADVFRYWKYTDIKANTPGGESNVQDGGLQDEIRRSS